MRPRINGAERCKAGSSDRFMPVVSTILCGNMGS